LWGCSLPGDPAIRRSGDPAIRRSADRPTDLRASEQPGQCIIRHVVEPSPGDHEHVADRIVGRRRVDATPRVRTDGGSMRREQALEPQAPLELIHSA
jgi:hypothetical protein